MVSLAGLALACGQNAERRSIPNHAHENVELAAASPQGWFLRQTLRIESPVPGAFGRVLAMSGDTALIGKPDGGIFAYSLEGGEWGNPQELVVEGMVDDAQPIFSFSAAISGNTAVIGTPNTTETEIRERGAAFVFSRIGSTWQRAARIEVDDAENFGHFGASVAIDGDLIVVGAPMNDTAYVFARVGEAWIQQKQLVASDEPSGFSNRFGEAVAISGGTVVVGAPYEGRPDFVNAGKVYAYAAPSDLSGTWAETLVLPEVRQSGYFFGLRLAASGDTLLVGAPHEPHSGDGIAYAFTKRGAGYRPLQKLTSGRSSFFGDLFGDALALSSDRAVIGAPGLQSGPRLYPGAAYVYVRDQTGLILEEALVANVADGAFGAAVGIAGDSLFAGAPGVGPGGAAYVYRLLGEAGSACATDAECGLGHCVAEVCCERACEGACEECSTGACLPVPAGSHGSSSCGSYVCDGASGTCPVSCVAHGDCVTTHYCNGGECAPKARAGTACVSPEECRSGNCVRRQCAGTLENGMPCESASECARGHCVDGVCCNDACRQQCEACDVSGSEGECVPVTDAPHGDREPCAGGETLCAGRCDGTLTSACVYPTASTECDSRCEDDAEVVSVCDGQGQCVEGDVRSCGRLTCGATACKERCENDDDCSEGLICWEDGTCNANARCVSAVESETAPGGSREECGRYLCGPTTGTCRTRCTSTRDDCSAPNICDHGECVALPARDPAGCGCRTHSRAGERSWPVPIGLTLLAFARRRSRRRARDERWETP
jgi:hypothetical protein